MKKAVSIISCIVIAIMLLASCSPDTPEAPPQNTDIVLDESIQVVAVSGNDTVTLKGLKAGALYGINPHGAQASSRAAGDAPFISTDGGTQLFLSDGSDVTFSGADVGIMGEGNVTVVEYDPIQVSIDTDMVIDTGTEAPLYTYYDEYGRLCKVYEEYYPVDLVQLEADGLDRQEVALYKSTDGSGSAAYSFSFFSPGDDSGTLTGIKINGVLDLSDSRYDTLHVFNQVILEEGVTRQEIYLQSPRHLELDQSYEMTGGDVLFQVGPDGLDGEDMVIEINLNGNDLDVFRFDNRFIESRYASGPDAGTHKPYVFPMSYEPDGKVFLYAGPVKEDFIFEVTTTADDVEPWTIEARRIEQSEKALIEENKIDLSALENSGQYDITINVPSGYYYIPVIFVGDEPGLYPDLRFTVTYSDFDTKIKVVSASEDGKSCSSQDILDGQTRERAGQLLEYAVVRDTKMDGGKVGIRFLSSEFVEPEQPVVNIDGNRLTDKLSGDWEIGWGAKVVFDNLDPGKVYGFYLGQDVVTPSRKFLEVSDGFFLFRTLTDHVEFDAEDFGIFDDCTLQCVAFEPKTEFTSTVSADRSLLKTSEGDLVIDCYKLDISDPGIYQIIRNFQGDGHGMNSDHVLDDEGYPVDRISGYVYELGTGGYIFVQCTVVQDGEIVQQFDVQEKESLGSNGQPFDASLVYVLDANPDSATVLDMSFDGKLSSGDLYCLYGIEIKNLDGSGFTDSMPMSVTESSGQVYIGPHEGTLIVSFDEEASVPGKTIKLRPVSEEEAGIVNNKFVIDEADEEVTFDLSKGGVMFVFLDQQLPGPLHFTADNPNGVAVIVSDVKGFHWTTNKLDYVFKRDSGLQTICVAGYSEEPFVISIES